MSRRALGIARLRRGGTHLLGYMSGTVLLALTSIVTIPALISADGLGNWSGLAVGQAVGAFASAAAGLGLRVSGPSDIAAASPASRRGILNVSIRVRLALIVPVVVLAALIGAAVVPDAAVFVAIGVLHQGVYGLSSRWYLVGIERPALVFITDAAPRIGANLLAVLLVFTIDANLTTAGLVLCVGTWASCALTTTAASWDTRGVTATKFRSLEFVKAQLPAFWVNVTESALFAAPVLLLGVVAPHALAAYAFFDKVYRQGTSAATPVAQVLQPWAARGSGADAWRRGQTALMIGLIVIIGGVAGGALIGPQILAMLSSREVEASPLVASLLAGAVGAWVFRAIAVRSILLPRKDSRFVTTVSTASSVFTTACVVGGATLAGSEGAVAGLAIGSGLTCFAVYLRTARLRAVAREAGQRA